MGKIVVLSVVNMVVGERLGLAQPSAGSTEIHAKRENCLGKCLVRARKRKGRLMETTVKQHGLHLTLVTAKCTE